MNKIRLNFHNVYCVGCARKTHYGVKKNNNNNERNRLLVYKIREWHNLYALCCHSNAVCSLLCAFCCVLFAVFSLFVNKLNAVADDPWWD